MFNIFSRAKYEAAHPPKETPAVETLPRNQVGLTGVVKPVTAAPLPAGPWYVGTVKYDTLAEAQAASDGLKDALNLKLEQAKQAASEPVPPEPAKQSVLPIAPIIVPQPSVVFKPVPQETPIMATPAVTPHQSGFITFFKKLGQDLGKVLPAADAVQKAPAVQALESTAFGPGITSLISTWVDRATVVEAATQAAVGQAASSSGTNSLQKASIVINSMTPIAQQLATQLGASALTVEDMQTVNNAVIAIANVFKVPTP
ncbi:MAG: hypothetical protein WBQ94_03735 [Terracidiphilus sp.]